MEGETGEVDSPAEGDWQCTDQTGDSVAPNLRVGKTLKYKINSLILLFEIF